MGTKRYDQYLSGRAHRTQRRSRNGLERTTIDDAPLQRAEFEELARRWRAARPGEMRAPLRNMEDILREPDRMLVVIPFEQETIKSILVLDKSRFEVIELPSRRYRYANKMSLAHVQFVRASSTAEAWLRSWLSGRVIKSDGSVG